jgi:inorganic pyrophosphatase
MSTRIVAVLVPFILLAAGVVGHAGNLLTSAPARNPDGSVNALIEIPAGTNAKWEVNEEGVLEWEMKDGKPRVVRYLAYPGSYGMVPGTLQSPKDGGDGDPLDVIVLGPALERGALIPVRLIGVLRLRDDDERDDKLIAVQPGSPLGDVSGLSELDERHPGVSRILEIWFENYKGPGRIESGGFADRAEAVRILDRAVASFRHEHATP